jgi:hypothetical protein
VQTALTRTVAWQITSSTSCDQAIFVDQATGASVSSDAYWSRSAGSGGGRPTLRCVDRATETACHAGHLDAVRELIDGRTWLG